MRKPPFRNNPKVHSEFLQNKEISDGKFFIKGHFVHVLLIIRVDAVSLGMFIVLTRYRVDFEYIDISRDRIHIAFAQLKTPLEIVTLILPPFKADESLFLFA